jgi:uncharacterized membrane protein
VLRNRWLLIALIVSVGINIGLLTRVIPRWFWPAHYQVVPVPERIGPGHPYRLGLSEEQRGRMVALREELEREITPLREALERKRRELFTLLQAPMLKKEEVERLAREISRLQADIDLKVLQNTLPVRDILSPEQRRLFFSLYEERLCPQRGKVGGRRPRFR